MYLKQDVILGTSSILVGYSLYNAYELNIPTTTQLEGYLWLEGALSYDLSSNQHDFTLYFDDITPSFTHPGEYYGSMTLGLTTTDLLNGSGFYSYYDDASGFSESGDLIADGMSFSPPPLVGGNGLDAVFNLLYLDYVESGGVATVNFLLDDTDTRSSVFKLSHYNDGSEDPTYAYVWEQDFSVQPVPVPATLWLFISGLAGLGLFRKRK